MEYFLLEHPCDRTVLPVERIIERLAEGLDAMETKQNPADRVLRESHLTVAPRVDRSLRVVSIALKFCNYALSSIIDRFISSASVEPFFEYHKKVPTAVQVAIAKTINFRWTDLVQKT